MGPLPRTAVAGRCIGARMQSATESDRASTVSDGGALPPAAHQTFHSSDPQSRRGSATSETSDPYNNVRRDERFIFARDGDATASVSHPLCGQVVGQFEESFRLVRKLMGSILLPLGGIDAAAPVDPQAKHVERQVATRGGGNSGDMLSRYDGKRRQASLTASWLRTGSVHAGRVGASTTSHSVRRQS